MTCRSRRRHLPAVLVALALAPAACGGPTARVDGPREAAAAFLERLASGDVAGVCRSLSANAVAELARDFGGARCAATAARAARYVAARPDLRRAVRGVVVLPTVDLPLSPAPQRPGASRAALRLVIDDPLLARRQAYDVDLRVDRGRWRIDAGIAGLFTLAHMPVPAPAGRLTDRRRPG